MHCKTFSCVPGCSTTHEKLPLRSDIFVNSLGQKSASVRHDRVACRFHFSSQQHAMFHKDTQVESVYVLLEHVSAEMKKHRDNLTPSHLSEANDSKINRKQRHRKQSETRDDSGVYQSHRAR